jgi:hypothetical protein
MPDIGLQALRGRLDASLGCSLTGSPPNRLQPISQSPNLLGYSKQQFSRRHAGVMASFSSPMCWHRAAQAHKAPIPVIHVLQKTKEVTPRATRSAADLIVFKMRGVCRAICNSIASVLPGHKGTAVVLCLPALSASQGARSQVFGFLDFPDPERQRAPEPHPQTVQLIAPWMRLAT